MENWWSDTDWEGQDHHHHNHHHHHHHHNHHPHHYILLLLHWHTVSAHTDLSSAFFLHLLASIDYSQYRLTTLILIFLFTFFHLVSPEIFGLPSYHQIFSPDDQPREE
jgi:Ca2+/H+ antiporter